jgi:hypothetical protein
MARDSGDMYSTWEKDGNGALREYDWIEVGLVSYSELPGHGAFEEMQR